MSELTKEDIALFQRIDELIAHQGWKFEGNIWNGFHWDITLTRDGDEPLRFPSDRGYWKSFDVTDKAF